MAQKIELGPRKKDEPEARDKKDGRMDPYRMIPRRRKVKSGGDRRKVEARNDRRKVEVIHADDAKSNPHPQGSRSEWMVFLAQIICVTICDLISYMLGPTSCERVNKIKEYNKKVYLQWSSASLAR